MSGSQDGTRASPKAAAVSPQVYMRNTGDRFLARQCPHCLRKLLTRVLLANVESIRWHLQAEKHWIELKSEEQNFD